MFSHDHIPTPLPELLTDPQNLTANAGNLKKYIGRRA